MLKLITHMGALPFGQLMEVYREGNAEAARDRWPEESPDRGLALAEEDFYRYLWEIFFPTHGAVYALWEAGGRPVSALRLEPYRDGLLVSALETAPLLRRRGYAAALLQAVARRYEGCKLYSHVSKGNVASLRTHEKCGFVRLQEFAAYLDGSVDRVCCTLVRQ